MTDGIYAYEQRKLSVEEQQRIVDEHRAKEKRLDNGAYDEASGLVMSVALDDTGRQIRTFENAGPRKRWMAPYQKPGQLQMRINKDPRPGSNERFEKYWRDNYLKGVK